MNSTHSNRVAQLSLCCRRAGLGKNHLDSKKSREEKFHFGKDIILKLPLDLDVQVEIEVQIEHYLPFSWDAQPQHSFAHFLDSERPWPGSLRRGCSAMVTHSKFDSAMSSCPFEASMRLPSYRYKTFTSKLQHQLILSAVRKLQESGFYWGTITGKEANALLSGEPAGTFLIRDSSDNRHFFTLSVKTASGTKNLRIQCDSCSFFLQTDLKSSQSVPRFDCVLKLVHHYMPPKGSPSGGNVARATYFIHSGAGRRFPWSSCAPWLPGCPLCSTSAGRRSMGTWT
ncbi:hypothetical protein GJAV_G00221570 [Gymnothorax javanicus]|nr:hypothetical protein GJAV_G00221570 [Gymnothorax javanicus]